MTETGSFVLFDVLKMIAVECLFCTLLRLTNAATAKGLFDMCDGEFLSRLNGFFVLSCF